MANAQQKNTRQITGTSRTAWPELPPLGGWQDTFETLHMWTQIVGKIRLECAPWINHSWGSALYVTTRGLTTSPIPYGTRTFAIDFDLAVTRFSGRPAPKHPGGAPNCADWVMEEAYSHEVSSAGFWPGTGLGEAAFYSYAYPEPDGFRERATRPDAAYFHEELGEFVLPYEAVRTAQDPDAALLAFLRATYGAAADLAAWDRDALEREAAPA